MSLVALKRKSRRFKAPISGRGTNGFSLNGGLRNQGWVGQTNLGRANPGTSFRGAYPMGNGGCCGSFVINTQNAGRCCSSDPSGVTIIKRSTMNTKGHIYATVKHPTSVLNAGCDASGASCKTIWVQDTSSFGHSSGETTRNKKIKTAILSLPWSVNKATSGIKSCPYDCQAASYHIGGKKYIREPYAKDLNLFSVSPGMYQQAGLMKKNWLPTPKCKEAFPIGLNHNSTCQVNFKTAEAAKTAGALAADWMDCSCCHRLCVSGCGN